MRIKSGRSIIKAEIKDKNAKGLEEGLLKELKATSGRDRIRPLLDLGSLYLEKNMPSEAEKQLEEALRTSEKAGHTKLLPLIHKNLGTANLKLFKLENAERYYLKAAGSTSDKNPRTASFIYCGLGDVYTKLTRMDEGLKYYYKSLKLRTSLKLWMGISEVLNKIGVNYFYQCDYNKALDYFYQSLYIREKRRENDESVAACLNNISLACYHKGDYPKALEYCLKTLYIYERTNNPEKLGMCYNNLGLIYFETSLFTEALECQFKALEYKERSGNLPFIANTLANIGTIYTRLFDLENALEYSQKALELRRSVNDIRGIANSYNELGRIYDKMNRFDKAVEFYEEAIKMRSEMNFRSGLSATYENLGMVYLKKKDPEKAGQFLFKAKNIAEELGEKKSVSGIYRNIASMYLYREMYQEALVYSKRSYDIAQSLGLKDKIRDASKMLSEIYGKRNNYKRSLAYYVLYSKMNEEILSIIKQNEINSISRKFESMRKHKENELYKKKNAELQKLNRELKKSRNDLIKSNSAKDKFFNIIAHDLKNPFSILYTTSEILTIYFDELNEKKRREYIKTINTSTLHLLKLIENLLEWSRTQSGLKQFNPEKFSFSEIITASTELIRPSAELKKISLILDIPEDVLVTADKNMLRTVIRNLVTNAVKFTKQGGAVTVSLETAPKRVILKVTDNGIGIRKKDIPKLFAIDKHYSTSGTANEKGTGIGLILCKEFIDKHKGRMLAESSFRKGSTFGFEIPV